VAQPEGKGGKTNLSREEGISSTQGREEGSR